MQRLAHGRMSCSQQFSREKRFAGKLNITVNCKFTQLFFFTVLCSICSSNLLTFMLKGIIYDDDDGGDDDDDDNDDDDEVKMKLKF